MQRYGAVKNHRSNPTPALKNHLDVITLVKKLFPVECHSLVWFTGGVVRDMLLFKPARDIDLSAALPPDRLASLGFRPVSGKTTPTVWFLHDKDCGIIEVTLLENAGQLAVDLSRRDFTINAMAMALTGELIDPLFGARDLQKRVLRACSQSSFNDDPLRIFRAFRFAAEGCCLAPDTEKLIRQQDWDERLCSIPVERFSREMLKAFAAPCPGRYFQQMIAFAVGEKWLPELFSMPLIPAGPPEYHPEGDLLTHSLQVLERVAITTDDPLARFCAFFHDLGKLSTNPEVYPKHHGHEEAGFKSAPLFARRLALPTEYGRALAWISRLHGNVNRLDRVRDSTGIRIAGQAIKTGIKDLLPMVAVADKPGEYLLERWELFTRIAAMTVAGLGIEPERLALLPQEQRAAFILQRRIERLRSSDKGQASAVADPSEDRDLL